MESSNERDPVEKALLDFAHAKTDDEKIEAWGRYVEAHAAREVAMWKEMRRIESPAQNGL
ncbi:hypothetical protein [Methylosinus sp. PW1]|uniref:hypothetical protein n=1 Tax=Methylosinus sp. PW1 TaxID=107636 RepID=UPI0012EC826F|nr:hypothetical protein [Methylosinus sp. PW1]